MVTVWESLASGEYGALEAALAPDAKWRGVVDGPWNCEDRSTILRVMQENRAGGRGQGKLESVTEVGERLVAAFRPSDPRAVDRPLEDGIAYVVVTVRDGAITELKGCADRARAVSYAQTGVAT